MCLKVKVCVFQLENKKKKKQTKKSLTNLQQKRKKKMNCNWIFTPAPA